jgi:hypothetical protein
MNEQFKVPPGKLYLGSCDFIFVVRCEGVPSAIFFFIKFMKTTLVSVCKSRTQPFMTRTAIVRKFHNDLLK